MNVVSERMGGCERKEGVECEVDVVIVVVEVEWWCRVGEGATRLSRNMWRWGWSGPGGQKAHELGCGVNAPRTRSRKSRPSSSPGFWASISPTDGDTKTIWR